MRRIVPVLAMILLSSQPVAADAARPLTPAALEELILVGDADGIERGLAAARRAGTDADLMDEMAAMLRAAAADMPELVGMLTLASAN